MRNLRQLQVVDDLRYTHLSLWRVRRSNALSPYIYTAARAFYDAGVALVHPLYYDFDDSAVFGASVIEVR